MSEYPEDIMKTARTFFEKNFFSQDIDTTTCIAMAIQADRDRNQWQTIDTAPKNTKVLAAYQNELGNWRIVTACYHTQLDWSDEYGDHEEEFAPEAWYEENDSSEVIYPTSRIPTHWQPLPSPPKPVDTSNRFHGRDL